MISKTTLTKVLSAFFSEDEKFVDQLANHIIEQYFVEVQKTHKDDAMLVAAACRVLEANTARLEIEQHDTCCFVHVDVCDDSFVVATEPDKPTIENALVRAAVLVLYRREQNENR